MSGSAQRRQRTPPRPPRGLSTQVAGDLRDRLNEGEWQAGERLPTEGQLSAEYQVSRATVRSALQLLETQGRTTTRHGLGTFVSNFTREITAGLPELRSMSETIRSHGMEPSMDFHSCSIRGANPDEASDLGLQPGDPVLALERAIIADDEVVAYSYDAIPAALLPEGFEPATLRDSLFDFLESCGAKVETAVTDLHAAAATSVGWGHRPATEAYLLLDQVHYSGQSVPVLTSRTYFAEGHFQFSLVRQR